MSAEVNRGELNETILKTQPLKRDGVSWQHISSAILRDGHWKKCEASESESAQNPVPIFNNSLWWSPPPPENRNSSKWYSQDCVWTIDGDTEAAFRKHFDRIFSNQTLKLELNANYPRDSYGEAWIKSLYRKGRADLTTVNEFTSQIAASISAQARMSPRRDWKSAFVYGRANRTETCIHVRWGWIAYPAGLLMSTVVFLILTMLNTHKRKDRRFEFDRGAWKSSSLAVLFAGLDQNVQRECAVANTNSEMTVRAENLSVSLQLGDDGWKLRGTGKTEGSISTISEFRDEV